MLWACIREALGSTLLQGAVYHDWAFFLIFFRLSRQMLVSVLN
jgi:hypothetical protein